MKTLLLILFISLSFASCVTSPTSNQQSGTEFIGNYQIVEIDSCQYIYKYLGVDQGRLLTHKGNCSNPVHLYSKTK